VALCLSISEPETVSVHGMGFEFSLDLATHGFPAPKNFSVPGPHPNQSQSLSKFFKYPGRSDTPPYICVHLGGVDSTDGRPDVTRHRKLKANLEFLNPRVVNQIRLEVLLIIRDNICLNKAGLIYHQSACEALVPFRSQEFN